VKVNPKFENLFWDCTFVPLGTLEALEAIGWKVERILCRVFLSNFKREAVTRDFFFW